jgi:hypothetical protein
MRRHDLTWELTQRMRREMQIYARIFKAAKIEAQ